VSAKTPIPAGLILPDPEQVKISEINFATYNPRVMSAKKMKQLKASLLKHGLVLNLVIQKKNRTLIGGHQRVTAIREICAERGWIVPDLAWATVLDIDDASAKMLNVSLNKIDGDFDPYKLGELFKSLPKLELDGILSMGFEPEGVEELIKFIDPVDDSTGKEVKTFAKAATLSVEFATAEQRDQAKALLIEHSDKKGKKPGVFLLSLLKTHRAVA
jgi:ParB-like chromosome segregation protein Spo0J